MISKAASNHFFYGNLAVHSIIFPSPPRILFIPFSFSYQGTEKTIKLIISQLWNAWLINKKTAEHILHINHSGEHSQHEQHQRMYPLSRTTLKLNTIFLQVQLTSAWTPHSQTPQLLTSIFASKMFSLHMSQQVAPKFGPMWAIWTTELWFFATLVSHMKK